MGGKKFQREEILRGKRLRRSGLTWGQIGEQLGRSPTGIAKAVAEYVENGDARRGAGSPPAEVTIVMYGAEIRRVRLPMRTAVAVLELIEGEGE